MQWTIDTIIEAAARNGKGSRRCGDEGKHKLTFAEPAKALPQAIPFADATTGSMQGPRYTSLAKLLVAKRVSDLFA